MIFTSQIRNLPDSKTLLLKPLTEIALYNWNFSTKILLKFFSRKVQKSFLFYLFYRNKIKWIVQKRDWIIWIGKTRHFLSYDCQTLTNQVVNLSHWKQIMKSSLIFQLQFKGLERVLLQLVFSSGIFLTIWREKIYFNWRPGQ